jgi:hypothetical protein
MRQLIKKGDPRLNINMPSALKEFLHETARANKRSFQDEVIKRLAASFQYEETSNTLKVMLLETIKLVYTPQNE